MKFSTCLPFIFSPSSAPRSLPNLSPRVQCWLSIAQKYHKERIYLRFWTPQTMIFGLQICSSSFVASPKIPLKPTFPGQSQFPFLLVLTPKFHLVFRSCQFPSCSQAVPKPTWDSARMEGAWLTPHCSLSTTQGNPLTNLSMKTATIEKSMEVP